jgi:hypothetical protein
MRKFEAHITMPREQSVTINTLFAPVKDGWSYSQIDGDPLLGKRPYAYLTAYDPDGVTLLNRMQRLVVILEQAGVEVLRMKIEEIVFDSKTGHSVLDMPRDVREGDQPLPTPNEGPCVQDMVVTDIDARKALGVRRYGTVLQPFNGRDVLRDIYEELLDAAIYLRQLLYEREHLPRVSASTPEEAPGMARCPECGNLAMNPLPTCAACGVRGE